MSADNGIYLLHSLDGYRVVHTQAIDNLYRWYTCCDNPNIAEKINEESIFYVEECLNCKIVNPESERRDEICPERLKEIFGGCEVWADKKSAWDEAIRRYQEVMDDYMICEYGISEIEYDKEFPK